MNSHENQLPPFQKTPAAWYGPELAANESRWIYHLSDEEAAALKNVAAQFLENNLALADLNADTFPVPVLKPKLAQIRKELLNGCGVVLLRGLNLDDITEEVASVLFVGVGAHLGNRRAQNANGDLLGHVRDVGLKGNDPKVRIYQTNERQTFHTDSADVVGLICLQPAVEGGQSMVVSGETVFNEMRKRNPELLALLMEPIATDRRGEVPEGAKHYCLIPVFTYHQGRITNFYQRQYIESAQRFEDAPRLTARHHEALDLFDELCNDKNIHISMDLQKGDMQFVNNHSLLHDRTGFKDHPDLDKRRHLLRLWLSMPDDRELDPVFTERYGSITVGDRGGYF